MNPSLREDTGNKIIQNRLEITSIVTRHNFSQQFLI